MKRIEVSSRIVEQLLKVGNRQQSFIVEEGIEEGDVLVNVEFNQRTGISTLWFDKETLEDVSYITIKTVYE